MYVYLPPECHLVKKAKLIGQLMRHIRLRSAGSQYSQHLATKTKLTW